MIYDIAYVWEWLVLVALIGGVVGWRQEVDEPQTPWFEGWFRVAVIALVVGAVAAILHLVSGRAGFWLETAVLFFVAYVIGCLIGGALKRLRTAA